MKRSAKGIAVATAAAAALTGLLVSRGGREPGTSMRAFDYGPVVETTRTQTATYQFNGMDSQTYPTALVKATLLPHRSLGYRIKPKGRDFWSAPQTLAEVVPLLGEKVGAAKLGQVWWAKAIGDGFLIPIYRYDSNPLAYMATPGTDAIDLIVGTVVQRFPSVGNLGIQVCKRIAGSSSWSQHSWGNGVDFGGWGGPWGSATWIANLDAVNAYVARLWTDGILPVAQLGWRNWPNHYPGHIHVSGSPMRSGTPECA